MPKLKMETRCVSSPFFMALLEFTMRTSSRRPSPGLSTDRLFAKRRRAIGYAVGKDFGDNSA